MEMMLLSAVVISVLKERLRNINVMKKRMHNKKCFIIQEGHKERQGRMSFDYSSSLLKEKEGRGFDDRKGVCIWGFRVCPSFWYEKRIRMRGRRREGRGFLMEPFFISKLFITLSIVLSAIFVPIFFINLPLENLISFLLQC